MPTTQELAGLYEKGKGDRNVTPLLETTGGFVWSGDTDADSAVNFNLNLGVEGRTPPNESKNNRAFAVRSRK
jgi:hypothetical protein